MQLKEAWEDMASAAARRQMMVSESSGCGGRVCLLFLIDIHDCKYTVIAVDEQILLA